MHTILIAADNRKIREVFPQDPNMASTLNSDCLRQLFCAMMIMIKK
jgi:hypothetical protein